MRSRVLILLLLLLSAGRFTAMGQEEESSDSLVRLMNAQSVRMVRKEDEDFREVTGPASFLHNNTYLLCDTALWNIDTRIINATGNVRVIQDETVLSSDSLVYLIDADLARFRGGIVQLVDRSGDTLRTRHLDYNTRDSVAVFDNGGAMKDKDGQLIESVRGTYDSRMKTFTFEKDVNMFTDSIFIRSRRIEYRTDLDKAFFDDGVDAWKDDNMLSSRGGWYDKGTETFLFDDGAHILTEVQEGWSDSLYYYRDRKEVEMLGNAQLTDTTRNSSAVAGRIVYVDSLSTIDLFDEAAVVTVAENAKDTLGIPDTIYMGADHIRLFSVRKCDIDSAFVSASAERCGTMEVDAIAEYRSQSARKAAEAAEKAKKEQMEREGAIPVSGGPLSLRDTVVSNDSLSLRDSLFVGDSLSLRDSLAVGDSLTLPPDTSAVHMVEAQGRVRVLKKDIQIRCDSLLYSDFDSLARLYLSPVVWNEINRQYVADSIYVSARGSRPGKAFLMSDAFIMIQEDSVHYDQIKSTEMMAHFDSTSALSRFDALGEVNALFYISEKGEISMANKVETRLLSANFSDGEMEDVYYYDSPKNDAYPLVQLPSEFRQMKGFSWDPDSRPSKKEDITLCVLRQSERQAYLARPGASFPHADKYFPGYIDTVRLAIARNAALSSVPSAEEARDKTVSPGKEDSLAVSPVADTLAGAVNAADSVSVAVDTVAAVDTLSTQVNGLSARERRRQEREARWEEKNRRDEEKAAAKKARKDEIRRKQALKFLKKEEAKKAREESLIEKYMKIYQKRDERKQTRQSAGKRPSGTQIRRDVPARVESGEPAS